MKVKVYFDNAEERYKIYNGDTVITATEVTINEVAIDEQLSDTSANAVENRAVKKALDDNKSYSQEIVGSLNEKVDANKSDSDNKVSTLRTDTEFGLNALNSRIDEVIGQGMRLIKGTDISWRWSTLTGTSSNFQLPANTLVFIAIPKACTMTIIVNESEYYDFGTNYATNTQVGMFVTGSEIANTRLYTIVGSENIKTLIETDTTLLVADSPQELKDIRVDYYGTTHATAGDSVRYGMQLQKQTQDELEDVRVDAYGFEWSSAGDSVRSILKAIEKGYLDINKVISWSEQESSTYTGSAQTTINLPLNRTINITLPAETTITFEYGQDTTITLGNITATEVQEVEFTTDSVITEYTISVNSNSLTYDDLITAIALNMEVIIAGGGGGSYTAGNGIDITSDTISVKLYTDNLLKFANDNGLTIDGTVLGKSYTLRQSLVDDSDSLLYALASKSYVNTGLGNKQDLIDSTHKLDATLIQTSQYNNFVTLSEKQTWNGKQDKLTAGTGIKIRQVAGSNLFDVSTQVNGYLAGNGTISANDDLRTSDYIPIEAGKSYTISSVFPIGNPSYYVATYDTNKSNGTRIAITIGTHTSSTFRYYTFTASANGYFRFSYDKNEYNVMVNEGDTYIPYEPYGEIKNVISVVGGKSNLIIVDKNDNGDYTTLTEACNNAPNGSTILVYPAVYDNEIVKAGDKELSIIGVDKDKCIIQNDSGAYNDDPIQMTSGYLANVTVKANASSSYVYDSSVSENYCLHIDAGGVSKEMTVENCNFISYHWACIGIGLHQDQKVTIKNCELLNVQNDYSHRRLALSFHEGTGSNITNQLLILDNCRIRSKAGKTISYQRVSTTSYMELRFYNNALYDEINGINCLSGDFSRNGKYLNDTQTLELSGDSYGNNVSDFNI